jgi:hypothetical protein
MPMTLSPHQKRPELPFVIVHLLVDGHASPPRGVIGRSDSDRSDFWGRCYTAVASQAYQAVIDASV